MVFYAELDDSKILKYLKEEIRNKKFHLSQYGVLNKREPDLCYPINKSCNCKLYKTKAHISFLTVKYLLLLILLFQHLPIGHSP